MIVSLPCHQIILLGGGGNTDINKLRAANLASDASERARHAADQELHTAQTLAPVTANWYRNVTRGQKLRTSRYHKLIYETMIATIGKRIVVLEELNQNADAEKANLLGKMKMDVGGMQEMLRLVERLRALVVDEASAGWDWKDGLATQKVVRQRQAELKVGWGVYNQFVPKGSALASIFEFGGLKIGRLYSDSSNTRESKGLWLVA